MGYGDEPDYITDLGMWNYFRRMEAQPTKRTTARLNGNLYQEITPFKGLTLRAVQAIEGSDYRYTGKVLPNHINLATVTEESFERFYRLTSTNTAEYKFAIARDHHFVLLAGHESIYSNDEYFSTWTNGQTDERLTNVNHGTQANLPSYTFSEVAYNSFFSRLSYDFADKYYLDLTYRIDGSSLFGANRRYASFWSVGAMWNLKKEHFLEGVDWIDNLQLKASYGTMGNSGISNYRAYGLTSSGRLYDGQSSWYILRQAEFPQAEKEGFRLTGELQQRRMVPGLMGLEDGFRLGIEADETLGGKVRDGVVEFRAGTGDDVDAAGEGSQFHLFYLFRRNGLLKHAIGG